ncbi:histidine kinase dimerization/phospho-acceptor domain-containing protein [Thermodesulfobacteriota bacterium]
MDSNEQITDKDILHLSSLREVLGGFAHEIAQPLNAIMIASQVIQLRIEKNLLPEEEKSFMVKRLELLSDQVQRISRIVNDFRSYSGPDDRYIQDGELLSATKRVTNLMVQQFTGRGIEFRWETPGKPPVISSEVAVVAEGILIHALALARDTAEALETWHRDNGLEYLMSLTAQVLEQDGLPVVKITWNPGETPENALLVDPGKRPGLEAARSVLASTGGSLTTTAEGITIIFSG